MSPPASRMFWWTCTASRPWTPMACSTSWTYTDVRNAWACGSWSPAGSPSPSSAWLRSQGYRSPGSATGERYALAGFRRLIEDRAQRARDHADLAAG